VGYKRGGIWEMPTVAGDEVMGTTGQGNVIGVPTRHNGAAGRI
jgi:hypothetical protein